MLQAADLTIRLNAADDVVIARVELAAGTTLVKEGNVAVSARVPAGHKVAVIGTEAAGASGSAAASPPAEQKQVDDDQRQAALRAKAMENEGVQALLDVFRAEITKIEEM